MDLEEGFMLTRKVMSLLLALAVTLSGFIPQTAGAAESPTNYGVSSADTAITDTLTVDITVSLAPEASEEEDTLILNAEGLPFNLL